MRDGSRARRCAAAALPSLLLAFAAGAANPLPVLRVEAPPQLARQAAAVRELARADWRETLDFAGLEEPGPPIRVFLAPERSALAANVASWVSGYAVPEQDAIVLFPGRVPSYPDGNLEALLRHEVAHVLLDRAARAGDVPRWFAEGAATVAAREWGIEDGARVVLATIGRGPRSLPELDAGFSGDAAAASRSYAVSANLVRFLLRRHGEGAVARILAAVARGAVFEDAFETASGEELRTFAGAYFRRETLWTWVPFVTSSTVLWMAITALAILAIRRRRERDAELREAWAEEEREREAREAREARRAEDDPSNWN